MPGRVAPGKLTRNTLSSCKDDRLHSRRRQHSHMHGLRNLAHMLLLSRQRMLAASGRENFRHGFARP